MNLQPRYDYKKEGKTYVFYTKSGVKYTCLFQVRKDLMVLYSDLTSNLLEFIFFKTPNSINGLDPSVGNTISTLIYDVFNNNDQIVIYYKCSFEDSKQKKRANTFKKWHSRSPKHIKHYDNELYLSEISFYTGILIHENNANHDEISTIFKDFKDIII